MSEEFQNNYRDSGYEKSFDDLMHYDRDHHYADNRYLSNQTPTYDADDDRHLRHRTPTRYSSKRHLTNQRPKHYAEKRHVRHKMPEDYADKKCLPHRTPEDFADRSHSPYQMREDFAANKCLPYKTPDRYADKRHLKHRTLSPADKRHLPHRTQEDFVDKKCLRHQAIEDFADKRHLPHQNPEDYAANKCLPHKTPDYYADKRNLPQPMRELCADKRYPPRQTSKPYADRRHLPHQTLEDYADKKCLPQQTPEHCADKRHLLHQKPKDYADNKGLRHPMPKHYADKRNLPQQIPEVYADKYLPHQMPEPNIRTAASVRTPQSGAVYCKICNVRFGCGNFQVHNNGKRHQMLLALRELSMKQKTSNGQESRQTTNSSQVNPIIQSKEVSKSKKIGHSVESVSCEAPSIRHKEVSAEDSKRKFGDNSGAKDSGLKRENVSPEAPSFKHKKDPAERFKWILKDNTDAKDHGFKHEIGGETGGKYMKMNNGIRRPMKSSKPEVNALSNSVKSQVSELTPASKGIASPKIALVLVKGSSFKVHPQHVSSSLTQKFKGKEHHKVKNTTMEKNDQSHSTPVELNASAVGSSFEPPIQMDSQMEIKGKEHDEVQMSESKVRNEIQNHIVHPNDQQPSISIELQDPGSMTNNETEVVNSDSAANEIVLEPLASAPPDASVSNFEPQTEHDLHTEIEPQVSDAIVYYQSQHPSEISAETETEDESSEAELEMEIIQLPQVSVCLKCGNKGFEETLVYCNKCEFYALHRYCLDGPVVFTDEVIWFCEDCEAEVVDEDYPDSEILDSENEVDSVEDYDLGTTDSEKGGEVDFNEDYDQDTTDFGKGAVDSRYGCSISVDPLPIADPVWRGSLQLVNRSFELMSHLSTLACPKVLEETRHLPNVFYADLVQRSAVWPESFRKYGANNQSIGLYFFPENERVERYFDQLVYEMISNELAIRARVAEAELLIFSSTLLPSQYRRFQSKYYLWGMFRRKQTS